MISVPRFDWNVAGNSRFDPFFEDFWICFTAQAGWKEVIETGCPIKEPIPTDRQGVVRRSNFVRMQGLIFLKLFCKINWFLVED